MDSLARAVDDAVGLRTLHRRTGSLAKFLIVATFLEDAVRVVLTFGAQQQSMKIAGWEPAVLQYALPVLSIFVQFGGSLLVLLPEYAVNGCYTLIGWCVFHPLMYQMQTNVEFMLETTTIIGGLLVLLSHEQLSAKASTTTKSSEAPKDTANRLQMIGRVLITAIFIFHAFNKIHGYAKKIDVAVQALLVAALLGMSALVVVGMKSRWCALLLALMMFCSAFYMHPFWAKKQGVDDPDHIDASTIAEALADRQRYFFFQAMSTVGALLLLVVHGPGNFSVDEPEGTTETLMKSVGSHNV